MSKNIFFLLLSAILFFSAKPCLAQNSGRINYTINDNWRFTLADDPNSSKPEFADRAWERVNIPHTWNLKDVFDDELDYRRGGAWYRRSLPLDARHRSKRIFLYFEGANQIADVFVNGKKAGQHIGGYTAFVFDITDLVKFGGPNLIAVRVDNSFNQDIPPLTADFNFYGGIYRNVRVIAVDPMHIKITDHASSGLQISTPEVNGVRNTVRILGKLENSSGRERNVEVVSTILDAQGRRVGESTSKVKARPDSDFTFNQIAGVSNPKLWSPDNPYLYTIKTIVKEKARVLDSRTDTVGFRWFNFDPEKGFFLNGKSMMLHGTNRHQDIAGMGNAVPDALHVRDLEIIKDAGFNFVRLAHYPQSPAVLQAADRLGLLVWEEIPLVNYITISHAFNRNSEQMLVEMIRQHRNHPSVIMWGYMNEIFLRVPKENEENIRLETVKLANRLNEVAHREDPTRPTTIAFHGSEIYNTTGLGEVADITGWNLYSGWYSKTFEDFGTFIDDQHKRYPKRPLIISEYGANGDQRLHSRQPRRFDSTIEYQRMFHESYISQIHARPFIAGTAIWNQFDFAVEARGETIPHLNQKGMYTYDRKPKDIHYLYKANLSKSPSCTSLPATGRCGAPRLIRRKRSRFIQTCPRSSCFTTALRWVNKSPTNCTRRRGRWRCLTGKTRSWRRGSVMEKQLQIRRISYINSSFQPRTRSPSMSARTPSSSTTKRLYGSLITRTGRGAGAIWEKISKLFTPNRPTAMFSAPWTTRYFKPCRKI